MTQGGRNGEDRERFCSISEGENADESGRVYVILKKDPQGPQVMGMSRDEFSMLLHAGQAFSQMEYEQRRVGG